MNNSRKLLLLSGGGSYTPEAKAIFAAFTTKPNRARKELINTLVSGLITAGIWSKLDVLYLLAAADSQAARINWKSPGIKTISPVGSPTFADDKGYTGNGSSAALDTTWVPSTDGVNYVQDDASIWAWCLTEGAVSAEIVGNNSVTPNARINPTNATNGFFRINDATTFSTANTTAIGFYGAQRRGASDKRAWKNGSQLGATQTTASTGVPTQTQWICGASVNVFSDKQIAGAAWGASLTGLESSFYNLMLAYMQGVGAV